MATHAIHGSYKQRTQNYAIHEYFITGAPKGHQIAEGRYSSVSEYIRELIRSDEKRKAEERLTFLLLEGLESEESELVAGDFEDIRKEAIAQLKHRKKLAC